MNESCNVNRPLTKSELLQYVLFNGSTAITAIKAVRGTMKSMGFTGEEVAYDEAISHIQEAIQLAKEAVHQDKQ